MLEVSQSAVTAWESARALPDSPELVWTLEAALDFRPGALSRLLGYLPLAAEGDRTPPTVQEAVASDQLLDSRARDVLLAVYAGQPLPRA